jgi:hypothetical protein
LAKSTFWDIFKREESSKDPSLLTLLSSTGSQFLATIAALAAANLAKGTRKGEQET